MSRLYKAIRRILAHAVGDLFLVVQGVIARLPLPWIERVALALSLAAHPVIGRYRRAARINLDLVFGAGKSPAEKERIIAGFFLTCRQALSEYFLLVRHRAFPPEISVRFEGEERLRAARARGKGVILASAHYGNFFVLISELARRGYRVHPITRAPRNRLLYDFLRGLQADLGIDPIPAKPRRECARQTLAALRANEIVVLLLDQHPRRSRDEVEFFGRPVAVYPGLEVLARRTGAAVLPAFIASGSAHRHAIAVEPELSPEGAGPFSLSEAFARRLESRIRADPVQWWWFHRRFARELYSR